MLCPSCQKEIADGSRFCYNCGARLGADAPPPPPAAVPAPAPKRLVRSTTDRKVAGVCAGVADYLDVDVTLVRVIWLIATLVPGPNILAYIILWIALPEGPTGVPANAVPTTSRV